jgi:paired amphipathic helix protein Sin3a
MSLRPHDISQASEGSGAHRKNLSEEALAFSEQERHWFSIVMQTNQRAIALLDPVCHRIEMMDMAERGAFKLQPGFGGSHASVVERAIKKIYGSDAFGAAAGTRQDHAQELIQALYEVPGTSVPIILSRMKQKDQDWKRALKEWDRVWREVDAKNYYRSLDHQSVSYKINDKKTLTTKSLTADIDQLRRDQQQKIVTAPNVSPERDPSRAKYQFELHMEDKDVFFDMLKLTLAYLDRSQSGFSAPERERVEGFIRLFTPMIFGITQEEIEEQLGPFVIKHAGDEDDEAESEVEGSEAGGLSAAEDGFNTSRSRSPTPHYTGPNRPGPKAIAADLRRRLLAGTLKHANIKVNGLVAEQRKQVKEHSQVLGQETTWIQANPTPWPDTHDGKARLGSPTKSSPTASPAAEETIGKRHNFFCGSTLYSLIRTFHVSLLSGIDLC